VVTLTNGPENWFLVRDSTCQTWDIKLTDDLPTG